MTSNTPYDNNRYTQLKPGSGSYWLLLVASILVAGIGAYAAYAVEHAGHHITGMNNHVVWGLPHVFAISLIVAASGALNGASLASVFGNADYKPYARVSIVLALSLLVGGLIVLVLDLGRPDRLIVAMTHYNFYSIFSWNIFLYTGFIVIGVLYLWMLMERRMNRYVTRVGVFAFLWRIVLTSGTGSIFGFLVARDALDTAIMAPLFIALSLVMGTAVFALLLLGIANWQSQQLPASLVLSLEKLMLWFVIAVLYFSVIHHVTNLYAKEHHGTEAFALAGQISPVFWLGHVMLGAIIPLFLIVFRPVKDAIRRLLAISALTLFGGAALVYTIVIGSQSTPQRIFPDHTVLESSFGDAGFDSYQASLWEWGLGLGGLALSVLVCLIALRIMPFAPIMSAVSLKIVERHDA